MYNFSGTRLTSLGQIAAMHAQHDGLVVSQFLHSCNFLPLEDCRKKGIIFLRQTEALCAPYTAVVGLRSLPKTYKVELQGRSGQLCELEEVLKPVENCLSVTTTSFMAK